MKDKIKVWAMIEGPIHKSDLPKEEQENYYGGALEFFAVCKVEVNGRLEDHEFYFDTLDQAYQWKRYFEENMEALEINKKDFNRSLN